MPFMQGDADTVFEFKAGLLRGTQWVVDLAVCQSPCCPCLKCQSTWSPVVATETAGEPHRFWLDLGERCLERPPTDKDAGFADAFLAQATAADWGCLLAQFRAAKQAICADVDLTTVDADFDFAEIEETGLLVAYNEIFPFDRPLRAVLGGRPFSVLDCYCLNPRCDCTDVRLSFCAEDPPGPGGMTSASEVLCVTLDWSRRAWELSRETGRTPVPAATLVAEFLANVDAYRIFPERQRVLRALYRHNRGKFVTMPVRAGDKVGRNDPCPCGSGRKYKKCCMGTVA